MARGVIEAFKEGKALDGLALACGAIKGVSVVSVFGYNDDVSTTEETVSDLGVQMTYLSTAVAGTAVYVSSTKAVDASAGTGARTLVINSLDGDYAPQVETVSLAGDTAVNMAATSLLRFGSTRVATVGTGGVNAGIVHITTDTGTAKNITGITAANPAVVTSASHGFSDGDYVRITGVVGMTEVNDRIFIVANKDANTFELTNGDGNVDSSLYTAYTSGGTATEQLEHRKIAAGNNNDLSAVYTIPAGYKGMIAKIYCSSEKQNVNYCTMRVVNRPYGGGFNTSFKAVVNTSALQILNDAAPLIAGKTDIEIRATASAGTVDVNAGFQLILIED